MLITLSRWATRQRPERSLPFVPEFKAPIAAPVPVVTGVEGSGRRHPVTVKPATMNQEPGAAHAGQTGTAVR